MIFNMNGGGTALNFRVVGGTSAPSDLKENTIWVNTSTAITDWVFSATQPIRRSNNKNLIVYPYSEGTKTTNGITYTVNSDGSINASGTATATAWFTVCNTDNLIWLEPGTYTFSGCPNGGGAGKVKMALRPQDGGSDITDGGSGGVTFTLTKHTAFQVLMAIYTAAGKVSNIVFKPQLEAGSSATSFVMGDATGQVWVSVGTSSQAEFNALKKNSIQVYPLSAKQYVGGVWVNKEAKSYQGGEWAEWIIPDVLFRAGNENVGFTGGWEYVPGYKGTPTSGYPIGIKSITTNGYLRCERSDETSANGFIMFRTKNIIDLTDYNTLTFKNFNAYTANSFCAVGICVDVEYIDNMPAKWKSSNPCNVSNQTITLDISKLSGNHYVAILVGYWGGSSASAYVETNEIILSK